MAAIAILAPSLLLATAPWHILLMLEHTFCHIPGVSLNDEQRLWCEGIRTWNCLLSHPEPCLKPKAVAAAQGALAESRHHLEATSPHYFFQRLPSRQHWRIFPAFRERVAYVDIETTGLVRHEDIITTIALYDGTVVRWYVNGENLDEFAEDIRNYDLLVTYNGKCFDVPVIERALGVKMPKAHIDLRYIMAALGFRGGLKGCEKALGLSRGDLDGVDGYFAVILWREWQRTGDRRVLETLLAYNIEDVVNLESLMVAAYNLNIRDLPLSVAELCPRPRPRLPFEPHLPTIRRLRQV